MDEYEFSPSRRETRARMTRKRKISLAVAISVLVLLLGGGTAWAVTVALSRSEAPVEAPKPAKRPAPSPTPEPEITPEPEPEPEPEPAPPAYDIDSPDSLTVVVNKQRPLQPIDWEPYDLVYPEGIPNNNGQPLRAPATAALAEMNAAATADGYPLVIASAYRSYWSQQSLFERYAANDGIEAAETYSARPGHSEHQTGLVVDLTDGGGCTLEECFGATGTGIWLRDNAHRFGFILRYPEGQQATVGYIYEPWHFRYVGTEVSVAMREQGVINLEDFFGLPPAPGY